MLTAYSFDYRTREFTGAIELDVTDLDPRALGVVLVPGNATTVPPPRCGKGLWPFWRNGRWHVCEIIPDPLATDYYANL